MKRFFRKTMLLLGSVMMCWGVMSAQDMPIPVDKDVRIGKLDNGMTYYIRHNETPKGQADFYIAQKVGSILEEENQRGLAHFLEHMCFNGTKNFPGSRIVDWCESIGVKFGYNLNAYTSVDQTVYNISNVPVARESVQDSCLLILHDWANDLLLQDEEINKERGVIHQEWRRAMVGQMRLIEKLLPVMFPNTKYATCLPIGTMEVVDNFPSKALRDYYEAWYRPDQQGVIVVGDIDVDRIEAKIKEMFGPIQMPKDAKERTYFPVPDNDATIFAIGSDPEMPAGTVSLMFKNEPLPKEMKTNISYLAVKYMLRMATMMLNNRFTEMDSKPDTPFTQGSASYGDFFVAKTKSALSVDAASKDGNVEEVVKSVYREILRAKRGGFTFGEYERARNEYISRLEKAYNSRKNTENSNYVSDYVDNFLNSEPIPSIEDLYQAMNMLAPNIPLEGINQLFGQLVSDKNRVVLAMLPEKEGVKVPTEAELAAIMSAVDAEEIAPYVDETKSEPLIPNLPKAGKIVSKKHDAKWDATELTLSNGVKILVKPTKLKENEVIFTAWANGGTSVFGDEYANEIIGLEFALSQHGLGAYTYSDLQKYLSGKQANVGLSFQNYGRRVSGKTTTKDLPTMMELLYMSFTNVTMTEDEAQALKNQYAGLLETQASNPQFVFQSDLLKTIYDSPACHIPTAEVIRAIDREKTLKIAHEMTKNAADFDFLLIGDFKEEDALPLIEQYIATLPADAKKSVRKPEFKAAREVKTGKVEGNFKMKMQTPQTFVFYAVAAKVPYTSKSKRLASILGQILTNRLLKNVREDMGAVYSISAQCSMSVSNLNSNTILQSMFPMKPEMKKEVLDYINAELGRMESDITAEELSKSTEFMLKNYAEARERNDGWANAIASYFESGVDSFNNAEAELKAITVDDVKALLKQMRAAGNNILVLLDPEE